MPNDTTDTSGPVHVAPAPAPASQGIVLPVNGKNAVQVAAFAVVAALTGGGVSFANNPKEDIAAATAELKQEIKDMADDVEVVALSMQELKSDLKHSRQKDDEQDKKLEDLEKRMRECEKK